MISKIRWGIDALLLGETQRRVMDEIKISQGRILSELNARRTDKDLNSYEFKVFSQWGEDGILQFLTSVVPISARTFIEFGVETFSESNCRFLMMKDRWAGYVIDGSAKNIRRLRSSWYFWMYNLKARCEFINCENIGDLLDDSGFGREPGILSIDIDGMDYWILQALVDWRPCILICEYNGLFGHARAITVPYEARFTRSGAHYSNLYYGASLRAFHELVEPRGYAFVGCNMTGTNAFWVRRDLMTHRLREISVTEGYVQSQMRESRNQKGRLTYLGHEKALAEIRGLPVVNTETGVTEVL